MGRVLWLPDVLAAARLDVVRYPGWEYRGQPTLDEAWQVFHHTASNRNGGDRPSIGTVANGRPDLPGPLCQALPTRSGVWVIIASGRANHAGVGRMPDGDTDGNDHLGWEVENDGLGEPWSERLLDSVARGMVAVARYKGWPLTGDYPARMVGHKEYALPPGRKTDPSTDLAAFRRRLVSLANEPPGGTLVPTPEEPPVIVIPPEGRNLGPPILISGAGVHFVGARGAFAKAKGMVVVELPNSQVGVAEYKRWKARVGMFERLLRRQPG